MMNDDNVSLVKEKLSLNLIRILSFMLFYLPSILYKKKNAVKNRVQYISLIINSSRL